MKEPFVRAKKRDGRCFELSYKVVTTYPNWALVHGVVRKIPGCNAELMVHAWAEKDDLVHDPVLNSTIERNKYYELYVIEYSPILRYSSHEAQIQAAKSGNYGCWDSSFGNLVDRSFSLASLLQNNI